MKAPIPRILCVEDNKDSREMMRTLLDQADIDYSVTLVETGAEALALIAQNSFDLYILDIWLQGMDGLELCRRIRDRGITKPIMFFSAMVRPDDRGYVLAAGANEYLLKPNDLGIFTKTVERLLREDGNEWESAVAPIQDA